MKLDPALNYLVAGPLLERLLAGPGVNKDHIAVREVDGKKVFSFAHPTRFKGVRNGVVCTFEIPALQVPNTPPAA